MASYHPFTSPRTTTPDFAALQTQLRTIDPTIGVQYDSGTLGYSLKKNTPWTAPEISQAQTVIDTAPAPSVTSAAQYTSRQKDVLTTCALIVRARGIPAWNALTVQQKKDAAFAEADVWRDMRIWAETNL